MSYVISEKNPPPFGAMGGSVAYYDRCLDPFHADAFAGISLPKDTVFVTMGSDGGIKKGERRQGWMAYDWCHNPIGWAADGDAMDCEVGDFFIAPGAYNSDSAYPNNDWGRELAAQNLKFANENKRP